MVVKTWYYIRKYETTWNGMEIKHLRKNSTNKWDSKKWIYKKNT